MTSEEIRDIAIDSASSYYDFLDKNEKGIQEVDVFELLYLESRDLLIKLRLSAKLFDTEAIFFKQLKNGKKYDTSQVKIIEYDNDKNMLLIRPGEEIIAEFQYLKNTDLKVISDLKFLIQRVKVWYEVNGAKIALPVKPSKYSKDLSNIKYFPEKELQPSKNQLESIANIFTQPFSYVWGAPGTGKTQFVLSYAVLHYINNNDKIVILAPTNNSIEQVLRGVLKMTDKARIDRKQILRLGTPSKKFAEEFPEVCEQKGVQKRITEIYKQINILERIISYEQTILQLNTLEQKVKVLDELSKLANQLSTRSEHYNEELKKLKKKEIDIKYSNIELASLLQKQTKEMGKVNSFGNKLKKIFTSKQTSSESSLVQTEKEITEKGKEIEFLEYEYSEISKSVESAKSEVKESTDVINERFEFLKKAASANENLKTILEDINLENWSDKKAELKHSISDQKQKIEIDSHLMADYKHTPLFQLQAELDNYNAIRTKLAVSSTEERLQTVNVVACTLDGYIGRYTESKLNVEHIFLDEAGYANIVKTLTLFNHTVPISFLGDHMQLPPVCEINDIDIQRDEKFSNMFLWAQSAIYVETLFANKRHFCINQYLNNTPFNPIQIKRTSLNSTFRFGSNLAEILSRHVYQGNFNSLNPIGETKIHFIDARKVEGLKSRVSMTEVEAIKKLTEKMKQADNTDYVILTPYKKQVKLLNSYLPQERNDLKILTVHGSQGREWDTVILSVVDTSDKWFVDSTIAVSKGLNLVNTAVSRAKKNLIIVCDKRYWINLDGQLITDLIRNGDEITD